MILVGSLASRTSAPVFLQEAGALSSGDVTSRLSAAVDAAHRGLGSYGYYLDHIGDDESGDVVYRSNGEDMMCPYDFDAGDGSTAAMPVLHMDAAERVMRRATFEPVPDDTDEYTSQLEESLKAKALYTALPLYERFISKGEREKADDSDFAGKGKSFPILKAADVMAAVRSMGRAGSGNYDTATLKKNIIRIAKRKGFTSSLPKSWQGSGAKESGTTRNPVSRETVLTLVESAATCDTIVLQEARADYEIKLIAPGKGSSAFYPAEVLKRDGPKVFKKGTHVYLNHPTAAEEAQRPEGDVANLAGVLTTDATYHESHAKGAGLFARMKVFADHATQVEEKAPYVGMSIRAMGQAQRESSGKPTLKDGLPVLASLDAAESVDVVTRAGAGGMILTEGARPGADHQEDNEMDAAEFTKLQESNRRLLERALRSDAREQGMKLLEGVSLPHAAKLRVIEAVIEAGIPSKDDALDLTKFTEAVNAQAQKEGRYVSELTGAGRVVGMGSGPIDADPKLREAEEQRREREAKQLKEAGESVFAALMGNKDAGILAASKGEAA